ncbi:hypothetical protein [Sandarakinorhabdus rubra]|uniref:hypothetical protein n=1 Tax=Sandarakinorhabdus rubra TaxID=2672568 RepID=UPI001F361ECE|nr:hypothetical protein [Sandarakinorhabdus rubra]
MSIAIGLLLVAIGGLASLVSTLAVGLALALASWLLAEYFTRQRRMALPSILLLLGFVGALFVAALALFGGWQAMTDGSQSGLASGAMLMVSGGVAAAAAALHWWRFRVPITIAAGAAGVSVAAISMGAALLGPAFSLVGVNPVSVLVLICGLGVFALAMWFDGRDPARITRRSDVAFWLHLLAAPMLVHPLFSGTGLSSAAGRPETAAIIVIAFGLLTLVALAIDRRALIVSALGYAIYAMQTLFGQGGLLSMGVYGALLMVGLMLVFLSAAWRPARALLIVRLPVGWRASLPTLAAPPR